MNLMQAAVEAAKNPTIFTGAGRVLVDGTIIVAILKIAEAVISRYRGRQARAKARLEKLELVTPAPKPGESDTCKKHLEMIEGVQTQVQEQGRKLAGLDEFRGNTNLWLERIDTKIDDLRNLIIGREK